MMSSMPEFIRGNQRSYLRIGCDREELERDYEYHMYTRNDTKLLLRGSFRNMDGEEYLYFDISARQSLDVLLQVKKLNREMAQRLFTDILRLCDETDKYLLNLRKVSFRTRHIMYSQEQNDFRFLYNFSGQGEQWQQDLAQFSEMMVERLDYSDDKLMEVIYRFYEMMTDSQEAVDLRGLAQMVLKAISDSGREASTSPAETEGYSFDSGEAWGREAKDTERIIDHDGSWNMEGTSAMPSAKNVDFGSADEKGSAAKKKKRKGSKKKADAPEISNTGESLVRTKHRKSLLIELFLCLAADIASVFLVEPGNISVMFLQIVAALICLVMIGRQLWLRRRDAKEKQEQESEQQEAAAQEFQEEFQNLMQTGDQLLAGTQIIAMEEVFPKLYSVYGREPEYIEIVGHQLVGSQEDLVQVCLRYSGVSRIHASLRRDPQGNSVLEDLNSTNGTWVNDSRLSPRAPYTLRRGDKVSFAGCEYIFR
ncbi:MAG: FHA domain-containing protein [Lachnospiraceae bacterium]|nr:FHA domain-containing protein [Lachnospiraceae bacterium]